jgi:hypothetical protein
VVYLVVEGLVAGWWFLADFLLPQGMKSTFIYKR